MKHFCKHNHDINICGRSKDGHCIDCKKIMRKSQYQKHKEKEILTVNKYRVTHKDEVKKRHDDYDKNHPEKRRTYNLRHARGIELEVYNDLFKKQEGKCAICGNSQINTNKKYLCIDHDHTCCDKQKTCGKCVRGLLCHPCNRGLGQFNDSIDNLEKALQYLLNYNNRK